MFAKSIRWRILLWLAFLLIGILSGFGVTAYQLNRVHQLNQIDEALERRVTALSADWRQPQMPPDMPSGGRGPARKQPPPSRSFDGPPDRPRGPPGGERPPDFGWGPGGPEMGPGSRPLRLSTETANLLGGTESGVTYYQLWESSGTRSVSSPGAPADIPLPDRQRSDSATHYRFRDAFREAYHFTERGECVLVGMAIAGYQADVRRFAWWLVAAGAAVLAIGLGGGWMIASRVIRPVELISAAAGRISAGNLSERINVADTDQELGDLAAVLNSTFARLEASFAEQKRFTADASHELRTPLAIIIAEAQMVLARERDAADYRATVEGCLETAQEMRRLTERLLEFARFDAGQVPLEHAPLDLAVIVQARVEQMRALAAPREIQLFCDLAPAPLTGDAARLAQVVTNLLGNAIHYNRDGGEIHVATSGDGVNALLTVTDTGVGIAAEDLPHIFERFYRADKARSRAEGHAGLGLAICRMIVEAHGGTIAMVSTLGSGASITVRLPVK